MWFVFVAIILHLILLFALAALFAIWFIALFINLLMIHILPSVFLISRKWGFDMSYSLRKKPVKQYRGVFVHRDGFGRPLFSVRVGVYGFFYQCRFIPQFCFLASGCYYWVKWVDLANSEIGIVRCGPPSPSILTTLTFDQFYNNFFSEVA